MEERVKELIVFIVTGSDCESALLHPDPIWYIFTDDVLAKIQELWMLDYTELREIVNKAKAERKD